MSQKRSHPVHNYYEEDESGKATCKTCQRSLTSINSTNLVAHLKHHHKDVYQQYEKQLSAYKKDKKGKSEKETKFADGKKQTTLEESVKAGSMWPADHYKAIEVHDQIAKMVVIDGHPFNVSVTSKLI